MWLLNRQVCSEKGVIMKFGKNEKLSQVRWHYFVVFTIAVSILVAAVGAVAALAGGGPGRVSVTLLLLGAGGFVTALIMAVFAILLLTFENINSIRTNTGMQENILEILNRNRAVLEQISHAVRLSDSVKATIFRDVDTQSLREMVLGKLHQQDFDRTYEIIDNIAHLSGYEALAEQLRLAADKYRDATQEDRINQVIAYIEKLFEQHQWYKANTQIESLIKTWPGSEKAKAMRQRLLDRKEQRKKELLAAWDEAVKRQQTDRSLEILKELDLYLTPNEGLALQESARDVFRTKLHNLGVAFSLAVTERQWAEAHKAGVQIIRDFPNSRMAQEIRDKLYILQQRAGQ